MQKVIEADGGRIIYIELRCSEEVSLRRLGNESRAEFGKLRDKELYREIKNHGGFDYPPLPEVHLTIDTETTGPDDAVRKIQAVLVDI